MSIETRVGTSRSFGVKPARTTLSDVAMHSMISEGRRSGKEEGERGGGMFRLCIGIR